MRRGGRRHVGARRGRGRRSTCLRLMAVVFVVSIHFQPSSAAGAGPPATGLGKRYGDGLDSRLAAQRLTQAASSVGYTSTGYTSGRSASDGWGDGLGSAVFGFFGHANAGIAQTNDVPEQFLAAGTIGDVDDSTFSYWSNYLPFLDVDDMKLAVVAGCYTANRDLYFGSFGDIGRERGIDSVVGFTGLVMYPASCTDCNYSGNYFWDRFSTYAQLGETVGTALSKARADLVAKEGSAAGWEAWYVQGAVRSPLNVRITPAGWGQPLDSKVLGIDPFDPFSLKATSVRPMAVSDVSYIDYTTAEGVSYRRDAATGDLTWLWAPPSTEGPSGIGRDHAERIARAFAASHVSYFDGTFELVKGGSVTRTPGDALAEFTWRPMANGVIPGPASISVTVDLRKGSVVDFVGVRKQPTTGQFSVTEEQAVRSVTAASGEQGVVSSRPEIWGEPRWVVTLDRGLRGRVPDVSQFVVSARSGEVIFEAKT